MITNAGRYWLRIDPGPIFHRAVSQWPPSTDERRYSFALAYEDEMPFKEYVRWVAGWPRGEALPEKFVRNGFYVGVVNGTIVGRLSVRFQLNDFLSRIGGHIGYGVRPGYRRRGYASAMLRQAIPICAAEGIERALVTCDTDNVGSSRVIERCGGVFEGVTSEPDLKVQKRRYWLSIPRS